MWLVTALLLLGLQAMPAAAQGRPAGSGCPVNDFQLLGQRWRAGNVFESAPSFARLGDKARLSPLSQPHDPQTEGIVPDEALWVALRTYARFDATPLMSGTTVPTMIIVVDDFSTPTPAESHGAAVYSVLERMVGALGVPTSRIGLSQIDLAADNYNLNTVATRIEQAIRSNSAYRRFVINMSFVIIPCQGVITVEGRQITFNFDEFIGNYRSSQGRTALLTAVAQEVPSLIPLAPNPASARGGAQQGVPGQGDVVPRPFAEGIAAFASDYTRGAYNPRRANETNDPLRRALMRLRGLGSEIVVVASSGNFGQPGSFAPGSFPEVISVSASLANNFTAIWTPTNGGEVMAPGAWYPLGSEFVAGTSFSAPAMSGLTALLLSSGDVRCSFISLMNGRYDNPFFATAALGACRL
jgi:subtilisin family serine protease